MKLRIIKANAPDTYRVEEQDRSAAGWHAVGSVFDSVNKAHAWGVNYLRELERREAWNVGEVVRTLEAI